MQIWENYDPATEAAAAGENGDAEANGAGGGEMLEVVVTEVRSLSPDTSKLEVFFFGSRSLIVDLSAERPNSRSSPQRCRLLLSYLFCTSGS